MGDLGFWFLNDVVWVKTNPMPNFRGVRFANSHETLIWSKKDKKANYTFNYDAMKNLNEGLQMRSDWHLPLCTGQERLKENGEKAHSTQKPEALLYRIILATSNPGEIILDPFFGTGTTGAVAKKLNRKWIGIEKEQRYIRLARERIDNIKAVEENSDLMKTPSKKKEKRIPFGNLLEKGILQTGQKLFSRNKEHEAQIAADGSLITEDGFRGSIHKVGAHVQNKAGCNGWTFWYYEEDGELISIDRLREKIRQEEKNRG